MSVTIKDVAREAGVSVATVSRVLNNSSAVSDDTAETVNTVIKKLGYSPNFLGRNLRKCETNNILVVIPSTEQTFYSEIIKGMQDAAFPDYDVLLSTSYSNLANEERLMGMLFNRTVDAAVILGSQMDAARLNVLSRNYNIALCCERVEGAELFTVTIDNEAAAYDAVTYLLSNGRKRVGLVTTGGVSVAPSSVDREKGYTRALADHGIEKDEQYIYRGTYDYTDGFKALDYFMSLDEPPEAVFCISDLLAVGLIKQAYKRGIAVGSQLMVCGFDNINLCEMYIPEITTISQPGYEMGKTVIEGLIANMHSDEKRSDTIILEHKLIRRASSD